MGGHENLDDEYLLDADNQYKRRDDAQRKIGTFEPIAYDEVQKVGTCHQDINDDRECEEEDGIERSVDFLPELCILAFCQ